MRAVEALGGECFCCGDRCPRRLSIDHINNDGAEKRQGRNGNRERGADFYRRIVRGELTDDVRLACYSCNCSRNGHDEPCHDLFEQAVLRMVHASLNNSEGERKVVDPSPDR